MSAHAPHIPIPHHASPCLHMLPCIPLHPLAPSCTPIHTISCTPMATLMDLSGMHPVPFSIRRFPISLVHSLAWCIMLLTRETLRSSTCHRRSYRTCSGISSPRDNVTAVLLTVMHFTSSLILSAYFSTHPLPMFVYILQGSDQGQLRSLMNFLCHRLIILAISSSSS